MLFLDRISNLFKCTHACFSQYQNNDVSEGWECKGFIWHQT